MFTANSKTVKIISAILLTISQTGCTTSSEQKTVSLEEALIDIKKSMIAMQNTEPNTKIGVLGSEITVTLNVKSTTTRDNKLEVAAARLSTPTTAKWIFGKGENLEQQNTIVIKFVSPYTQSKDTILGQMYVQEPKKTSTEIGKFNLFSAPITLPKE